MQLEHLKLNHFRNLAPLSLHVNEPIVLLVGDNAQGKTNVLEAVYLCTTGRSFRAAAPRELIAAGEQEAGAQATFSAAGVRHQIDLKWQSQGPHQSVRQRLRLDGRHLRQASELLNLLQVVAFFPEDLAIAKAGPEARRRFIDRAVAGGRPSFVEASLEYQRALRSRNAVLRRGSDRTTRSLASVYDDALARHGAHIHVTREQGLSELWPHALAAFGELMPNATLSATLRPGFCGLEAPPLTTPKRSADEEREREAVVRAHLAEVLASNWGRDQARGLTCEGPHRADFVAHIGGHDARTYASQGQQRCLVLALKVAELQALSMRLGHPPLLLLDDVSSELDRDRLARFFHFVESLGAQTWISSTGSVPLPLRGPKEVLRVAHGQLFRPSQSPSLG